MEPEFRIVEPSDEPLLAEIFGEIDETFFRPHPFTRDEARRLARLAGQDVYALLLEDGRAIGYGMLRGWDEGYDIPTLGIAVRTGAQGRGFGRAMMAQLHDEARRRGAAVVRLRVHEDNARARRLYESLGYWYAGTDRGELVMLLDLQDGALISAPVEGASRRIDGRLLDVDALEWAAVLGSARHDFYHLPRYVALCAAQEHGRPCALYVADGRREMLLPLILREIDGEIDATSPYGYPGPLVTGSLGDGFIRIALAAGRQVLQEAGVVSAFIRFHPILNPSPPTGFGLLVQHGDSVSIDLTAPADERWAQMRLNHRRDITRATQLGFVARMDEGWEHLETFKRLYRATMARREATPFYFFDDAYFDDLRRALRDSLHLCLVERNGVVAAAGLFVVTGDLAEYHLSGTDESSMHIQPTKLMLHFVSGWARDRGCQVLHLGGGVGGRSDTLLHFKLGFSRRVHPFSTLRMVIDWPTYRRLVLAVDPALDPGTRDGFFPLYRRP